MFVSHLGNTKQICRNDSSTFINSIKLNVWTTQDPCWNNSKTIQGQCTAEPFTMGDGLTGYYFIHGFSN